MNLEVTLVIPRKSTLPLVWDHGRRNGRQYLFQNITKMKKIH